MTCVDPGLNACNGCGALANPPGQPCGDCGDHQCTQNGQATECVDEGLNACGGCGTLQGVPMAACGACGAWQCRPDGTQVDCADPGLNACMGCGTLAAAPGAACGACGRYECDASNTFVSCTDPGANACGGCSTLTAQPGVSCGTCGQWACATATSVTCSNPGVNALLTESWSTMAAAHSGCSGLGSAMVVACSAAINRRCKANATCNTQSGFGPVAANDAGMTMGCIDGIVANIAGTLLTAQNASCTNYSSRNVACAVAANRYCENVLGHQAGFGPVETNGTDVFIECVNGVQTFTVNRATLQTYDAACTEADFFSVACASAIHQFCSTGHGLESGFGPIEYGGNANQIRVACIS